MRYTVALFCLMLAGSITAAELESSISADYQYLEGLYRHLHQHPEISFQEVETAKRIGDELEHLGFEVTRDFCGHGVVGILRNGAGSMRSGVVLVVGLSVVLSMSSLKVTTDVVGLVGVIDVIVGAVLAIPVKVVQLVEIALLFLLVMFCTLIE